MGSSHRSSHQTNTASTATPTTNAESVLADAQPTWGAWISPYTTDTMPTTESAAPKGSSRPCSGSWDLGTRKRPATSATIRIGTLTRNTEPYQ